MPNPKEVTKPPKKEEAEDNKIVIDPIDKEPIPGDEPEEDEND